MQPGPAVAIPTGMLLPILPLIALSIDAYEAAAVPPAKNAQVQLADALATADTIDRVSGHGATFTFAITRGDHPLEVIATTVDGEVVRIVERERGFDTLSLGGLSWLADTMRETVAVARLDVDEDGAVTLTTSDGMRYMAIPGRGSGGNTEVEARWAAEWDREQS